MYASYPQREPLIVHDVPERPWQKVGCDIFTLDEKDYPCTVDYYFGYFKIDHLERKTARSIITRLKRHFSMVYLTCFRVTVVHPLTLKSLEISQQLMSSS